jgi:hypothetical protein
MSNVAVITPGQLDIKAIPDDPADNKILVCSLEGKAEYIISGYHHLKDLKIFQGIKIVDPADINDTLERLLDTQTLL